MLRLTVLAGLTYWIATTIVVGLVTLYVVGRVVLESGFDIDVSVDRAGLVALVLLIMFLVWSVGIGAIVAFTRVRRRVRNAVADTLQELGAVPATGELARVHNIVEELAIATGIPKAGVAVVDDPAP